MKVKYLFPVLAGLAFSACSQDEDMLNTNVQKGDYSPITFSVSRENVNDADTRVWEDEDTDEPNFTFAEGDLLSLWNGMTWGSANWTSIGQNAIFEGQGDGESVQFRTKSLVNKGTAIMVYPADTAFVNEQPDLKIAVESEQNATTNQSRPYISDVMKIGDYSGDGGDNTAGYGRHYDILLRPIGTLFRIGLDAKMPTSVDFDALGVDPIEFTSVELKNNTTNLFVKTVKVSQSETVSSLKNDESEKYKHFEYMSDVSPVDSTATVKTTHVDGNYAYFTLLPKTGEVKDETCDDDASIVVETTYGTVTVANNSAATGGNDAGPLQNRAKNQGNNLKTNLLNVLELTWVEKKTTKFGKEKQGSFIGRTLTFDLSDLNMNNTVVRTSKQLIDLLKVKNALGVKGNVTWKLAGATEDDGNFVMTGAALTALETYNADKTVTLDINDKSNNAIVLSDGATLEALNEALKDGTVKLDSDDDKTVMLSEAATLDQGFEFGDEHIKKIVAGEALTITNTDGSSTPAAYELTANGNITFSGTKFYTGALTTGEQSNMTIAAGQTINFSGKTTLNGLVDNEGYMVAGAAVENKGNIDNKNEISVMKGQAANKFTNLGIIYNNDANGMAITYISDNADDTYNPVGLIYLSERDDEVSIESDYHKGFVVYHMDEKEGGKYTFTSKDSDAFNWLIVGNAEDNGIEVVLNGSVKMRGKDCDKNRITIRGTDMNVKTPNVKEETGKVKPYQLFVEKSMRLLQGNEIEATYIYVEDYILHAGGLTGAQQKEYNSKVAYEGDAHKDKYKNGVIRTIGGN